MRAIQDSNDHETVQQIWQRRRIRQKKKYEISKCDLAQSWVNSLSLHLAREKNPETVLEQTFFSSDRTNEKSFRIVTETS